MDSIISQLESVDFNYHTFLMAAAVLLLGTLFFGFIGRYVFGKKSAINHAVSSAIGILFLYAVTIVLYSAGIQRDLLVAPLPFVEISGDYLAFFQFSGAHYAEVCSQLLSMIILAFLVNLLDMLFSKEKKFFGWLIFRCLSVFLSLLLHLVVTYLFRTYLPEGIVIYAPTVLLWLLLIMLAVGALKVVVGLVLATVNPIIGALYTFFFATLVGKQLSKAVLTTTLLTGLIYALNYIGVTGISIVGAALIAYIPFAIALVLIWYLLNKLL